MKKTIYILIAAILSVGLVACSNNNNEANDNANNNAGNESNENAANDNEKETTNDNTDKNNESADENNTTNDVTDEEEMKEKMSQLDYIDFELEVDYESDKEYEAEIEQNKEKGTIKADLEDEINGEDLKGIEAFNKIYPLVEQLTINQDTDKEDAIAEILDVFDLDDDYEKFEVEITFSDGTEIEFEDK